MASEAQRYRLKLSRLDFISPVDAPAQETAKVCLIKREGKERVALTARVAKVDEDLGLVFCWAFTSQVDGADYFDLQRDNIDQDFVKAAADFMIDGGLTDEMHDSEPDGRVVFCMPMTPEIAKAFDIVSKTMGLMIALKPSADVLAKFKSGEYAGVSIAGVGERTAVKGKQICKGCQSYVAMSATSCPQCGAAMGKRAPAKKGTWSTATVDDFPDSSFLYIEPGGKKDGDGKTTPRSLRHFPYRDENGKIDLDHLRDATGRIPQSSLPSSIRNKLQVKAEKLLAAQHNKRAGIRKEAVLTSEEDGHQHAVNIDDPAHSWMDVYSTSYATAEGATQGHAHAWTFDPSTGEITIAADSGHTHTVDTPVPADALAVYARRDAIEDAENMREAAAAPLLVQDEPSDGVPMPMLVEESSGAVPSVTINMRGPDPKSTPSNASPSVKSHPETNPMNFAKALAAILALTDAERAYVGKLAPDAAEAFVGKSATDRAAIAKSARGDEVYKSDRLGRTFYATDDPTMIAMAKDADAQYVELVKSRADAEQGKLEKRASVDLSHFAKTTTVGAAILKAVDGIGDEAVRKDAIEALKGANAAMKDLGSPRGGNPGEDATNDNDVSKADAALKTAVTKYQADNKLASYELALADAIQKDTVIRSLWDQAMS